MIKEKRFSVFFRYHILKLNSSCLCLQTIATLNSHVKILFIEKFTHQKFL